MAYEIVFDHLPVRSVDATPVVLGVGHRTERHDIGTVVLALDADRDEFVRLPLDPSSHGELLALAHDGRHLLVRGPNPDIRMRFRVGIHTPGTGDLRFFDEGPDGSDFVASLSPDGRQVATLVSAKNPAHPAAWPDDPHSTLPAVTLIDVLTGHRRRIWTGPPGGWANESTIRWSPDGTLIAANYLEWIDERDDLFHATAVIDPDGTLIWHLDDSTIPQSNGAWFNRTELLFVDEDPVSSTWNLCAIDTRAGSRRTIGETRMTPRAALGNRMITDDPDGTRRHRLAQSGIDGSDPQPFITCPTPINTLDIAPALLTPAAPPLRPSI